MMSPKYLSERYQEACELDLQALKPGNVSIFADGHDMTVDDFRLSAKVSAPPLCNPGYSLGEKIFYAVKATREAVGCNTNLGIILLAAPLVAACESPGKGLDLRQALQRVLAATTVADADWAFKAIALASPGGLGDAPQHDVHAKATISLAEAMRLAAGRDRVALQYLTGYRDIFDFAVLTYYNAENLWVSKSWAAVAVFVELLAKFPDSHIERKYGNRFSAGVAEKMAFLKSQMAGNRAPQTLLPLLYEMDREFKSRGINPGTTADLTVATLLAAFLQDSWGYT